MALTRAKLIELIDNGDIEVGGGGVSPNILHNWDFRNPVNQRGVSGLVTNGLYGFDRWISHEGDTYFNPSNIALSAGGAIEQRIEGVLLAGKTVTVSILTSENGIEFASGVFPSSTGTVVLTVSPLTITLGHGGTYMFIRVKTSSARYIQAIKLELGTVSTLAYDPPMEYGTELTKCQRYFINAKGNAAFYGNVTSSGASAFLREYLPCNMRITPSLNLSSGTVSHSGGTLAFNGLTNVALRGTLLELSVTLSTSLTPRVVCTGQFDDFDLLINAEL